MLNTGRYSDTLVLNTYGASTEKELESSFFNM